MKLVEFKEMGVNDINGLKSLRTRIEETVKAGATADYPPFNFGAEENSAEPVDNQSTTITEQLIRWYAGHPAYLAEAISLSWAAYQEMAESKISVSKYARNLAEPMKLTKQDEFNVLGIMLFVLYPYYERVRVITNAHREKPLVKASDNQKPDLNQLFLAGIRWQNKKNPGDKIKADRMVSLVIPADSWIFE